MDKCILTALEEKASSFSKGQKRIARYILSDLQKAAFLTAGALGKETEVSESTVVRFATELGYNGFPQMQKALQDALVGRFSQGKENGTTNGPQRESILDTVKALCTARRIYLIARGAEKILSEYLGTYLEKQFPDVHLLSEDTGKLHHAGAGDVAFVFCFSPYSREIEEMTAFCRNAGAKVIGFTDTERSPIYRSCDICLFAKPQEKPYGLSLVRPMTLVEELLNGLSSGKEGTDEI